MNPGGVSRVWVPLPFTTEERLAQPRGQQVDRQRFPGQVVTDGKYGAEMVYAEWKDGEKAPVIEVTSRFATRDRAVDVTKTTPECQAVSGGGQDQYRFNDLHPDRRHRA